MLKRMTAVLLTLSLLMFTFVGLAESAQPVAPSKVSLSKTEKVEKDRTITLTPVLKPTNAQTTFTWKSSKPGIATVDENGVVTGVKPGKTVITVTTANKKKATCTVTVTEVNVTGFEVQYEDVDGGNAAVDAGSATYLALAGHKLYPQIYGFEPTDAKQVFTWKSSKSSVASVNAKGVITCKKAGTAIITATARYGGLKMHIPVKVRANAKSYSIADQFGSFSGYDYYWYHTAAKKVYLKDGRIYIDMYVYNRYPYTIYKMSKQKVYLKMDRDSSYQYIGSYKATLKKNIKPEGVGTITLKTQKVDPTRVDLTEADAYCSGTAYWRW